MTDPLHTLLKYEWIHTGRVVDFLLQRRRSLDLQTQILLDKIKKEEEALRFLIKGEAFSILEFALNGANADHEAQQIQGGGLDPVSRDTTRRTTNFYNWSIIEERQDFAKLQAYWEVQKKQWEIVQHLLALNEDELSVARLLSAHSTDHYSYWRERENVYQAELKEGQASDQKLKALLVELLDETKATIIPALQRTVANDSALVHSLTARIEQLQKIQGPLSDAVADLMAQIEKKERWLNFLESPLAPYKIYAFVLNRGPRILFILFILALAWFGSKWLTGVVLNRIEFRQYKTVEERAERIDTLRRASKSGFAIFFLLAGILFLLSEIGVNLSVLLGGAAIVSLAVAFGAQSLIKDYFSGFMVLTENQYRIGNVIRINDVTGFVEDITLRMTTIRDLDGVVHFIPHGEIKMVSNLTHGWSQVNADIKIPVYENVDRIMQVILEVSQNMRADDIYGKYIIREPELLGVEAFEEAAVLIKILIRTLPVKQWTVKREFLRRLKNRFDELGIDMALPTRRILYENSYESPSAADGKDGETGLVKPDGLKTKNVQLDR